jgi:hypothetical protein
MVTDFTTEDLDLIYIVVPNDNGVGTSNLAVSDMSSKQFRDWFRAKTEIEKLSMIVPEGRIDLEMRVHMLNRLQREGVKIYKLGG